MNWAVEEVKQPPQAVWSHSGKGEKMDLSKANRGLLVESPSPLALVLVSTVHTGLAKPRGTSLVSFSCSPGSQP